MIIQGSLSRKKEKDYPVLQTPFFENYPSMEYSTYQPGKKIALSDKIDVA
jgi:hypothetical protein